MSFTTHSYRSQEVINLKSLAAQLGGTGGISGEAGNGAEDVPVGGEIGVDFIPPLNAGLVVVVPIETELPTPPAGSISSGEEIRPVPDEFSWKDLASIRKYKGWALPSGTQFLEPPPNQGGCGACWAVNSAAVLGDRFAIWQNTRNPRLSGTFLISCNQKAGTGLCNGGTAGEAGQWFEKQGVPAFDCWDYSWCSNNPGCIHGTSPPSTLNQLVPPCQIGSCTHSCTPKNGCKHSGTPYYFKAKHNSTHALGSPEAIKAEIFHRGPVAATYRVFGDFLAGSLPSKVLPQADGWKKTKGVYIHLPTQDLYGYGAISCAGIQKAAYQCYIGNHTVSIVGWGKQSGIPNFLDKHAAPLTLEYWIVRNSWGTTWNKDGYFHMAISDRNTGINSEVAFDRIVSVGGQLFGGATRFEPAVQWVPRVLTSTTTTEKITPIIHTVPRMSRWYLWVGALLFAVIIGIIVERRVGKK